MQKGVTIWLTGLPGSGKSTIAAELRAQIQLMGINVELIDESHIGEDLNPSISVEEYSQIARKIGFNAMSLTQKGIVVICASVSPLQSMRREIRKQIRNFIEVYVKAPVDTCIERINNQDHQGEHKKNKIDMIIKSDIYEEPEYPELVFDTEKETRDSCVKEVLKKLEIMGYLYPGNDQELDKELINRLKGLGYL